MFVYPEYEKVPCLDLLKDITAKIEAKPEAERNEWASLWLSDLVRALKPKTAGSDDSRVRADVLAELRREGPIAALKFARARLGCGLMEARDYVEGLRKEV